MAEAEVLEILVFMMNFGKKHLERDIMDSVVNPGADCRNFQSRPSCSNKAY